MTPAARMQAAIDLLDAIIAAARDNGPAADTLIARYFKERRYAGSKDRRAVRDLVYAAIRRAAERPDSGRAAMVGLADERPELAASFDGSTHAPAPIDPAEPRSPRGAVPEWLKPNLAPQIDAAEQAAMLERAPLDLRVNRLKGSHEEALLLLRRHESGAAGDAPDNPAFLPLPDHFAGLPNLIRLPEGYPIEPSQAWQSGIVEVQDAGSQAIAAACQARPGDTVIDLCAGAGGKTLALAADMGGEGRLIAADVNRARLQRLTPRAERAGASRVETLLLDQGHEARGLEALAGRMDVVLIDAPCTGTGTWRRNPEARWRLTPDRLERVCKEQARILDFAAPLCRPGGRLIYAVCSVLDREGRDQMQAFLGRQPGWTVDGIIGLPGRTHGAGQLLTTVNDVCDGFFFARLVKA